VAKQAHGVVDETGRCDVMRTAGSGHTRVVTSMLSSGSKQGRVTSHRRCAWGHDEQRVMSGHDV
jgi:superfamily I DNA/RNA helicase